MKELVWVGGVTKKPVLRVQGAYRTTSIALTKPMIEILIKELAEALPHAPPE